MNPLDAARVRARRAALRRALYTTYPDPLGAGLLGESLRADLRTSPADLEAVLFYLADRQEIAPAGAASGDGPPLWRLTARGVEAVEVAADYSIDQARGVRLVRLRVLQALQWAGPAGAGPDLISIALAQDADLDLSLPSIARALAYLVERGLAAAAGAYWRITADGTDYLAGDGDGYAGVARPAGW